MSRRHAPKEELEVKKDNEEDVAYIQPNIEYELSKEKRQECQDIVQEIKRFGVNQRQILYLIQRLAAELENREAMVEITKACGVVRKEIPVGNKLVIPNKE